MDATIHQYIATQEIQRRIAEATGERTARSLKPRRTWFRRPKPDVAADRGRPVASPPATATPS